MLNSDDEGQKAEIITVKLNLQHKENIPALGENLKVLNVLSDSDDLVEHVDMGEVGSDKLAEDGVHVHDSGEGHNGYSLNGLIVSAVINDCENTKDDKLPEDVLKLMEYVPVDEKGDTMEDLGDHMEALQTEGDTTKQVDDTDTLEDLVEHAYEEGY